MEGKGWAWGVSPFWGAKNFFIREKFFKRVSKKQNLSKHEFHYDIKLSRRLT